MVEIRSVVNQVLSQLGASREARYYLKQFSSSDGLQQLDKALQAASIVTEKRQGLRVTTPEVMEVARPVIYRANRNLVHQDELGLVGHIQRVDLEAVRDVAQRGILPVVACLGENPTGQVMNINADIAARELIWAVEPHKIIFLTGTGGLLDEHGRIISSISLHTAERPAGYRFGLYHIGGKPVTRAVYTPRRRHIDSQGRVHHRAPRF